MEPNFDLSWTEREHIKEHAQVQNISLETAYEQIFRRGLSHTARPTEAGIPMPIPSGSLDRVHFTPVNNERGHGTLTFANRSHLSMYSDLSVAFGGTADKEQSWEQFQESLARAAPYLSEGGTDGWFTIDQTTGAWFGRGLEDFVTALTEQDERYDQAEITNPHSTETAAFLCPFADGLFCLTLQPIMDAESTWRLAVNFLTDGIPLNPTTAREIARAFDIDLTHAHVVEPREVKPPLSGGIEVVEQLVGDDGKWVTGLIARNPFYDEPGLLSDAMDESTTFRDATTYEYVEVDLPHHHPVDEEHEYRLKDATLHAHTGLESGFGITNLHLRADWTE